jgi:hypothetical protein
MAKSDADNHVSALAAAALERVAEQFVTVREQARAGAVSPGMLQAARTRIQHAARVYAAACGWQPPSPGEEGAPP